MVERFRYGQRMYKIMVYGRYVRIQLLKEGRTSYEVPKEIEGTLRNEVILAAGPQFFDNATWRGEWAKVLQVSGQPLSLF